MYLQKTFCRNTIVIIISLIYSNTCNSATIATLTKKDILLPLLLVKAKLECKRFLEHKSVLKTKICIAEKSVSTTMIRIIVKKKIAAYILKL